MRLRLKPVNYSCHHFVIKGRHHLETEMKSEKTDYSYAAQLVQSRDERSTRLSVTAI